jgi:hypothetical protein
MFSGEIYLRFDDFAFLAVLVFVWPFNRAAAG